MARIGCAGALWSMTFSHVSEALAQDQELWERERLPQASDGAFPVPLGFTEADRAMGPRADQLALMETLLRGFADLGGHHVQQDMVMLNIEAFDGPTMLTLKCGARC